ncbi:hypothetical protein BJV78DRAFT_1209717 [Lactifluus subvellereus]|nr:hypothetical protein BJV78DRAFT_1209717 [Lactifluus subvellereus]
MPFAIPSNRIDKAKIGKFVSPKDFTSLWGWIAFLWVWPLVKHVCVSCVSNRLRGGLFVRVPTLL